VDSKRLLDAPTGRRLCGSCALVPGFGPVRTRWRSAGEHSQDIRLLDELEVAVTSGNYLRLLETGDEGRLIRELARLPLETPVSCGPLYRAAETALLLPVAQAILDAPATQWWKSSIDAQKQTLIRLAGVDHGQCAPLSVAGKELQAGISHEVNRGLDRRTHTRSSYQAWTSAPPTSWRSTRFVPGRPPLPSLDLIWTWEADGPVLADYWQLDVSANARMYEVGDEAAWVALVDRYPRNVSESRRGAWRNEVSSRNGDLVLPNWRGVQDDFDGVHLTTMAFLELLGVPLTTRYGTTMIDFWTPDSTVWLNDVVTVQGQPKQWDEMRDWKSDYRDLILSDDGTLDVQG
jgi:hypothetical protein